MGVDKKKNQDFECWDLRGSMTEMSDDQLKKVAFLFLSRIYSVFDPQKQGKVPELIAKYELDRGDAGWSSVGQVLGLGTGPIAVRELA